MRQMLYTNIAQKDIKQSYELKFNDFQKQEVKFDIIELQKAYKEILKINDFSGPEGVSNFGAISLTQIPGDPDSLKDIKQEVFLD